MLSKDEVMAKAEDREFKGREVEERRGEEDELVDVLHQPCES